MSLPSGTFTPEDLFLLYDDNSNQTQVISHIGEQNIGKETVGLDLGKSSNKKQKKLRSPVWENFEKYTDENGTEWAKCNNCKKPFNGSSKMGTTHLNNHFKSCSKNKSNAGGGSGSGDKPAEDSVMDQQLNHLDRVKTLIKQCPWFQPLPKSIEAADLINVYKEEKEKLCIYFEELPCRFSLMVNMDYLLCEECICFSVHFIDDGWKLKEKNISWKCKGGDPIMKILKNVLSEWGIDNKISYMVLDGYSYEHVLSSNERENGFSSQGSLLFNGKLFCIPDFHYNSHRIYECICEILYDRMKEICKYITGNGNFLIAIDRAESLGKKVIRREQDLEDMDVVDLDWDALDKKVIRTEQDLKYMGVVDLDWDVLDKKVIRTEQDLKYIVDVVRDALGLKEAFFELENMESEFKSINLTKEEWDLIPTFREFSTSFSPSLLLHKKDDDTLCYVLTDRTVSYDCGTLRYDCETANMYFPWICNIYTISLEFVKLKPSIYEKERFHSLRDGMKCWYDDNLVLAVAALLDPRFKMDIVKHWYKKIYGDECETRLAIFTDYLTSVYNEYAKGTNNFQSYEMLDASGKPCKHHQSPNTELHLYLADVKFPLVRYFNILDWWRSNTQFFPTLARMARDFLSIKITIRGAPLHYRIPRPHMHFDSGMVKEEAFMCVKDWLKS